MEDMQCVKLWEEDVKPLLVRIKRTITFDSALTQTIEEILNRVDSDIAHNTDFSQRFTGIIGVLSSPQYILYAEKSLSKEDFNSLTKLSQELNKIYKIANHEYKYVEEVEETQDTKERYPNPPVTTEELYAPGKTLRKRIY